MKKRLAPLGTLFIAISIMGIIWLKYRTPEPHPVNHGIPGADKIQIGMTLDEVVKTLGWAGEYGGDVDLKGIKTSVYTWNKANDFRDGAFMVSFQNGKVIEKEFVIP